MTPACIFWGRYTRADRPAHTHTHTQLCGKKLFDPERRCWRVVTLIKRSSADYKWRAGSSLIRVNSCPNRIRRLQPSCTDLWLWVWLKVSHILQFLPQIYNADWSVLSMKTCLSLLRILFEIITFLCFQRECVMENVFFLLLCYTVDRKSFGTTSEWVNLNDLHCRKPWLTI